MHRRVNGVVDVPIHTRLTVVSHLYHVALQLATVGAEETAAADAAKVIEEQHALLSYPHADHETGIVEIGNAVLGTPRLQHLDANAVDFHGQPLGNRFGVNERPIEIVVVGRAVLHLRADDLAVAIDVLADLRDLHVGVLGRILLTSELGEIKIDVVDLVVGVIGVVSQHLGQLVRVILVRVGEEPCLHLKVFPLVHACDRAQGSGHVGIQILAHAVNTAVDDNELTVWGLYDVGLHQAVWLGCKLIQRACRGHRQGDLLDRLGRSLLHRGGSLLHRGGSLLLCCSNGGFGGMRIG